jgi:hypothetical protein
MNKFLKSASLAVAGLMVTVLGMTSNAYAGAYYNIATYKHVGSGKYLRYNPSSNKFELSGTPTNWIIIPDSYGGQVGFRLRDDSRDVCLNTTSTYNGTILTPFKCVRSDYGQVFAPTPTSGPFKFAIDQTECVNSEYPGPTAFEGESLKVANCTSSWLNFTETITRRNVYLNL